MATNQPLPDREPQRAAGEAASHRIAAALRRNRLTLLCGQAAAETSALLVEGLLPQLRRRLGDAAVSMATRSLHAVTPFPDRRAHDPAARAELAVFVSDWRGFSQASLHDGIDAALRAAGLDPEWYREPLNERVQSLGSRFGTRFLFVLDGFDSVLRAVEAGAERAELLNELVALLNAPVPANLLVAMPAESEILMSPLLERLHGVRAEVLMLEGGRTRRVYGPATVPPVESTTPPVSQAPASVKPPPTRLAQFDSARMPEAANSGAPTRPGPLGAASRAHAAQAAPALEKPPVPARVRRLTTRRLVAIGSVAFAAIVGGAVLYRNALPGENDAANPAAAPAETIAAALPAAPASPAPATAPLTAQPAPAVPAQATAPAPKPPLPKPWPAATAPRPSFALRVDADNAATRLPRELAQALVADGVADLQIVPTPLALAVAPGGAGSPGLAVVRYDALQAAPDTGAKPDLAVVAPLYTEELQVVVRADSPLKYIHQIEGRRINVGAAQGARAVTARALYRQMFDRPLPAAKQGRLDAAPALQQLLAGGALDAVVLVGPQPAAALAALPTAQRRDIKLLALAPDHPSSQRALQRYLPATLRDPAGGAVPSLAAMSFLVTTGRPDADAARTLARLATSLCQSLPVLQRDGDAKWQALRAGLQLETGWPQAGAADAAWRACAGPANPPTAPATARVSPATPPIRP